ncbi:MAG: hypothetical protein LBQ32_07570, partial [Burkholderiaceae bacterium]|nr:hypothetical protein [Burkholderiaceae bacterium]
MRLISWRNLLCLAALWSGLACAADAPVELPLTGPAYEFASKAYAAYARHDYETALTQAREAVRLRPDVPRLRVLLRRIEAALHAPTQARNATSAQTRNAASATTAAEWNDRIFRLQTAGGYQQAWDMANVAAKRFPKDAQIASRRAAIGEHLAANLLTAETNDDSGKALANARAAVDYAPNDINIRLFLIRALMAAGRLDEAKEAALRASVAIDDAAAPWIVLAYFQQRSGDRDTALKSYAKARASDDAGDMELRIMGLVSADAALAAGAGQDALDALAKLPDTDTDEDVAQRRHLGQALRDGKLDKATVMKALPLTMPLLNCVTNQFGVVCQVIVPFTLSQRVLNEAKAALDKAHEQEARDLLALALLAGGSSKEVQAMIAQVGGHLSQESSKAAYSAITKQRSDEAIAKVKQAIADAPNEISHRLLLIQILWGQKRYAEAETEATAAMALNEDDVTPLMMRAISRQQLGRRALARDDFDKAVANQFLDEAALMNVRLIAADAAIAAHEPATAVKLVNPYASGDDPDVAERLMVARLVAGGELAAPKLADPLLDRHATPYGTVSVLKPDGNGGYTLSGMAYQALTEHHAKAALELAQWLAHRYPQN